MITLKKDFVETEKAVGVPMKHNDAIKTLWFPKSQIINKNGWKKQGFLDVPDWLYDKKIDEAFL